MFNPLTGEPVTDEEVLVARIRPTLDAFEKAAEPHIRNAADLIYEMLLGHVEYYLRDNAEWNISERLRTAERAMVRNVALENEVRRLRGALEKIEGASIPDQPASSGEDELTWVRRWVGTIRGIAARALLKAKETPTDD